MDAAAIPMTCNVPAGSKDKVQPSCNSLFPSNVAGVPTSYSSSMSKVRSWFLQNEVDLPVMDKTTCRAYGDDDNHNSNNNNPAPIYVETEEHPPLPPVLFSLESSDGKDETSSSSKSRYNALTLTAMPMVIWGISLLLLL